MHKCRTNPVYMAGFFTFISTHIQERVIEMTTITNEEYMLIMEAQNEIEAKTRKICTQFKEVKNKMQLLMAENNRLQQMAAKTEEEWAVIGHLREYCHDSSICAICAAQAEAHKANKMLDQIICG